MILRLRLVVSALLIAGGTVLRAATPAPEVINVRIATRETVAPLTPLLWGTNLLFWIDDDKAVANGAATQLRDMSIGLLRFPGGTVAQNYDWRTNTLMNPARWPHGPDAAPTTDTDEFIVLCRSVGAEPVIVVNTEAWVLKGDLARGAKEAADWVRYCNIEKRYGVKYWEIGNENYYHVTQNAREYAECVNLYAQAMKAVDPAIRVAVNGPWAEDMYGEGDIVPPPLRTVMLDFERRITERSETRTYDAARDDLKVRPKGSAVPGADSPAVATILNTYEARADTPEKKAVLADARAALKRDVTRGNTWSRPWWETVIPICGGNVDVAVLHVYYKRPRIPGVVSHFEKVKAQFAQAHPHRRYQWFYSEFNHVDPDVPEPARAIENLELWLRLARSGMDMACVWPFRWRDHRFAALYDRDTGEARPHAVLLKEVAGRLSRGALVHVESSSPQLPGFCGRDSQRGTTTVALFGTRLTSSTRVSLSSDAPLAGAVRATAWVSVEGRDTHDVREVKVDRTADGCTLTIPAGSLVIAEFSDAQ